jgi:hypothetical protein
METKLITMETKLITMETKPKTEASAQSYATTRTHRLWGFLWEKL